jgi:hypothetical protein
MTNSTTNERIEIAYQVFSAAIAFLSELGLSDHEIEGALKRSDRNNSSDYHTGKSKFSRNLDAISRAVRRWQITPGYLDANGDPRALPLKGPHSIETLLRDCSIVDVEEVVNLATSIGYFRNGPNGLYPCGREFDVPSQGPLHIWCESLVARRALETLTFNARARRKFQATNFQRFAQQSWVNPEQLPFFRKFLREQGEAFLETVDDWLEQHKEASETIGSTEVSVHAFAWTSEPHGAEFHKLAHHVEAD